jgi:hypothetical protein
MAATARRNRLAFEQESAVMSLLIANGWTKLPSRLIDTRAQVNEKHFMHKTRFATSTVAHQEVDIACGLAGTFLLHLPGKTARPAGLNRRQLVACGNCVTITHRYPLAQTRGLRWIPRSV